MSDQEDLDELENCIATAFNGYGMVYPNSIGDMPDSQDAAIIKLVNAAPGLVKELRTTRAELAKLKARQFRVHSDRRPPGAPQSVPWEFMAKYEPQAIKNHDQNLEMLNSRGGLSVEEMASAIQGRKLWPLMEESEAIEILNRALEEFHLGGSQKELTTARAVVEHYRQWRENEKRCGIIGDKNVGDALLAAYDEAVSKKKI